MLQKANSDSFVDQLLSEPWATVVEFYQQRLADHPKAEHWLGEHFSMDVDQWHQFQVGFSDRTLGKRLPTRDSQLGRAVRDKLIELGIYKSTGHEALRGCVTFPLFDETGNITGIYGHRIDPNGKGDQQIVVGNGELHAPMETNLVTVRELATTNDTKNTNQQPIDEGVESEPTDNTNCDNTTHREKHSDDELIVEDNQLRFIRGDRHYRIRGLEKNLNSFQLKINLMASRDDLVHLDTLGLAKARSRTSFIKAAANELFVDDQVIKKDIGQLLLKLELHREQQIAEAKQAKARVVELSEQEQREALDLLRDPNVLQRIVSDMDACGIVGEATNKLTGYLAATSRLISRPLAIVIQSSSSAGKTSLMDAVLSMMPEESQVRFSAISGQSLYYLEHDAIQHKTLAISEDEGLAEATYALKLLQSEGELRHATVGKTTEGRMGTQEYHVQGPTQIFLTTTASEIDEELVNRCLVLTVDETRQQTESIHQLQRNARTLEAKQAAETTRRLQNLHQNAQRMLRPITVINPYAPQLQFASDKTRLRRDHEKYLNLIDTIALLHQHQREVKIFHSPSGRVASNASGEGRTEHETNEYIEVIPSDISIANRLAGEVLGQSLDELSPQTRSFLLQVHDFVCEQSKQQAVDRNDLRFTRRDIRQATGWSDFQVHKHLTRLVELEYLLVHRGKRGRRFVYELLYSGQGREGQPFLMGLIDPAKLKTPPSHTNPPACGRVASNASGEGSSAPPTTTERISTPAPSFSPQD